MSNGGIFDHAWNDVDDDYYGESSYAARPNIVPGAVFTSTTGSFASLGYLPIAYPSPSKWVAPSVQPSAVSTATNETPARLCAQDRRTKSPWVCPKCANYYNTMRNRDHPRHLKIHKKDGPWYRCRCGHGCGRKDNYTRHSKSCKKEAILKSFACICGEGHADKKKHVQHVKECGRSRRSSA
jgi:hypothetical protein